MKPALLDVNLLIALAWPSHVHHATAQTWFRVESRYGWVTCPLTQSGFVRVSSNPGLVSGAVTPQEALQHLRLITAHPRHQFWPADIELLDPAVPVGYLVGHRQVTDAYLLGLAVRNQGRLVTLDSGVASLIGRDSRLQEHLTIIRPTSV